MFCFFDNTKDRIQHNMNVDLYNTHKMWNKTNKPTHVFVYPQKEKQNTCSM